MTDLDSVQVLDSRQDLLEKATRFFVLEPLLFYDVVEKFATRHELHYEKQLPRSFNDLVELDDVGVPDNLEDLDFSHDSGDVGLVFNFIFF